MLEQSETSLQLNPLQFHDYCLRDNAQLEQSQAKVLDKSETLLQK